MPIGGGEFGSPLRHKSRAGCRSLPLDADIYHRATLAAVNLLGFRRGGPDLARPFDGTGFLGNNGFSYGRGVVC